MEGSVQRKMSYNIRNILERLDLGELDSDAAVREMKLGSEKDSVKPHQFLKVHVMRLHDGNPRVNIKIPLSLVGLGLAIGSKYAPELDEINLNQIVEDLRDFSDGTIVEVQDMEEDEHVLISIESE
jgi:hypothetical protein